MLTNADIRAVSARFLHLREFVDRVDECSRFGSLARAEPAQREASILVYCGPDGMGKTRLLDRFEFECLRGKLRYARLVLRDDQLNNPIEIMRDLVSSLKSEHFNAWSEVEEYWYRAPALDVRVQGGAGGVNIQAETVEIHGDLVAGAQVQINDASELKPRAFYNTRAALVALSETFLQGLEALVSTGPLVLLFEDFDAAQLSPTTREWIFQYLLNQARGFGGILFVMTMQSLVSFFDLDHEELDVDTLKSDLKPLDREHITDLFRAIRVEASILDSAVDACLRASEGIPLKVVEFKYAHLDALLTGTYQP